jgi:DNA (cytosine-5)-methyltransferase 1
MRPPFRLPSMAEVRAAPLSGLTHVSTFSCAGGTCAGLRLAGFETLLAVESDKHAQASYHANFPDRILFARDIREVTAAEILAATGIAAGELDLFEGSPPCTVFSTAGRRHKKWGVQKAHAGAKDVNIADLPFEWVRLLDGLRPRVALMENVAGLTMGAAVGYFNEILDRIRAIGCYRVEWSVLDAQWLGVPQRRRRVFVMAVRDDLSVDPRFPVPLPYRFSIREALGADVDHIKCFWRHYKPMKPWPGDRPALSILSSTQQSLKVRMHGELRPAENRELARLQTFPDGFAFCGDEDDQRCQIGNAVPPVMAFHIGCTVRDILAGARP